ncbi:MAG: HD domain-containing protein [Phycisphaerae bacterium]|nr:HD domain-containing protein [Phycisphaerae bacterium]
MTNQQLEEFKKWFYDYVATFYGSDQLYDDNIRLKEDHTRRVCSDIVILAKRMGLDERQKLIAETTGLFHDVGRFEQFKRFGSYNDVGTVNHATLGLEILANNKILDCLSSKEKEIIETAIRLHGDKDLADNLDEETELFAKLIRDADKLDIYLVMVERLDDLKDNPEKYMGTFGYPASEGYSQNIVQAVLDSRTIDYKDFQSINDMVIAMLGWVIDVNFVPTLRQIKSRGHLEKLVNFLPPADDIRRVAGHIQKQLETRINKG